MKNIIKRIEKAKHVVVISHISPDADTLSSASAVYTYLLTLHKKVSFLCVSKDISNKFAFLPWFEKIRNSFPSSADLAIVLDCGNISRIGIDIECDIINIDHHQSNSKYGEFNLVDKNAISTTKVLYDFFKLNDIPINKKMATALYSGILDDSNNFTSDNMDGTIFAIVQELINYGADYKLCNKFITKYTTLACLRLKSIMLSNMTLLYDAKVALFLVTKEDMQKSGAKGEDCESALEEALFLPTVQMSILLKENNDLSIKGSLRSCDEFDLSKITAILDGGGHKYRSGFSISNTLNLEEASKKVLQLIDREIKI